MKTEEDTVVTEVPQDAAIATDPRSVLCGCYSRCGVREVNQDMAVWVQLQAQDDDIVTLAAAADGMGGLEHGEVAAVEAIKGFVSQGAALALNQPQADAQMDIPRLMKQAFHAANNRVLTYAEEQPDCDGMGTTLVVATIYKDMLHVGSVGDSRCYLWREGNLEQLTHDDSFVQTLVDAGYLTREEADRHPRANQITRALGWPNDVENLAVTTHSLQDGDIILLCSDGFWKDAQDAIHDACHHLSQQAYTQESLGQTSITLVEQALERGADDNVSVTLLWFAGPSEMNCDETSSNDKKED